MIPSQEDIEGQLELLKVNRQTLQHYLIQRDATGSTHTSPAISYGIREARENIQRLKANLQSWGVSINSLPIDEESNSTPLLTEVNRSSNFQTSRTLYRKVILGSIITVVVASMVLAFIVRTRSLLLENIPIQKTTSYGDGGELTTTQHILGFDVFELKYSLPYNSQPSTGFDIAFTVPQDLSNYKYISFNIWFSSDQARCKLFLKDPVARQSVLLGDGVIASSKNQNDRIRIPLAQYFGNIDRSKVTEIVFESHTDFTSGSHSFKVSDIRFEK